MSGSDGEPLDVRLFEVSQRRTARSTAKQPDIVGIVVSDVQRLKNHVDRLSELVTNDNSAILRTEHQLSDARKELETIRKTNDAQINEANKYRYELEKKLTSFSATSNKLQSAKDQTVNDILTQLSTIRGSSDAQAESISKYHRELEERFTSFNATSNRLQSAKDQIVNDNLSQLSTSVCKVEASLGEFVRAGDLAQLRAPVHVLAEQLQDVKDRVEDVTQAVTRQGEATRATTRELTEEITSIKDHVTSLTPGTTFDGISEILPDATSVLAIHTTRTDELHKRLNEQEQSLQALCEALSDQALHHRDLEKSLDSVRVEASSTKATLESAMQNLRADMDRQTRCHRACEERIDSMNIEASLTMSTLEKAMQNLRANHDSQVHCCDASEKRIDALHHELSRMKANHEKDLHALEAKLTKPAEPPASIVPATVSTGTTNASQRIRVDPIPKAKQTWGQWLRGSVPTEIDVQREQAGELFSLNDAVDTKGFSEPDQAQKETSRSFFQTFQRTRTALEENRPNDFKKIKVLILDSGMIDSLDKDDLLYDEWATIAKQRYKDFTGTPGRSSATVVAADPVGHGTHCLGVILRITNSAEVHVGRVVTDSGRLDLDAIAQGLKYAVTKNIDIVSLSLGFDYQKLSTKRQSIEEQLDELEKSSTLVFAAASNKGLSNDEEVAWPASRQEVFGVYSAKDHKGASSDINPQINLNDHRSMFKFVGENIVSTGKEHSDIACSGTSVATAVAAATAAMIVEYIQGRHQEGDYPQDKEYPERARQRKRLADLVKEMRKPKHMLWLFQNMSTAHDRDYLKYLHPGSLLAIQKSDSTTLEASERATEKLLKIWDKGGRPR